MATKGAANAQLAISSSTDQLSVALQHGELRYSREQTGGAQASAKVLGLVRAVLDEAHLAWADVSALVVDRGPGAFTGVRVAVALAQGLAAAQAHLQVYAASSLLTLAEQARQAQQRVAQRPTNAVLQLECVLDARMQQMYQAQARFENGHWTLAQEQLLDLGAWQPGAGTVAVGNVAKAFAELALSLPCPVEALVPNATGLLDLLVLGSAERVPDVAQLGPVYVRNQVALTTAERQQAQAAAKHD